MHYTRKRRSATLGCVPFGLKHYRTACYVKGAAVIERMLEAKLGILPGQTRADGKASLSIVRCIGTCGLAPLAIFDGLVVGHVTAEGASERVEKWV
ncbi:MAG: hypothetical protein FJ303_23925 [Planctomycetes bacterium]|nr:hypothetical protein [Planctomycetota bacterium]